VALIEQAYKDDVEAEQVWKEQDDLLQTTTVLRMKCDST
jgi:hypothetical protein